MIVEILIIGDELLDGRRVDTNSAWLGRQLSALGVSPRYRTTVTDRLKDISKAFRVASERADLVISTGGLGPTQDDLTFEGLAMAFDRKLVYHEEIYKLIESKFESKGLECPPSNKRQANLPDGGQPLKNDLGTAPGCHLEINGKHIFSMPGVPVEMHAIFQEFIRPKVTSHQSEGTKNVERIFSFVGLPESYVEEKIESSGIRKFNDGNIRIAYTASFPKIDVTCNLFSTGDLQQEVQKLDQTVEKHLGEYLVSTDGKLLEEVVVEKMFEQSATLAIAESLTGGLLSAKIVDIPGSSRVFESGWVAYANDMKVKLGVSSDTLEKSGAVSTEVALEMAHMAKKEAKTQIGLSTTGIAGPDGGSETKPVGLTYVALVADKPDSEVFEEVKEFQFRWDRNRNRIICVYEALKMLLRYLEQESK